MTPSITATPALPGQTTRRLFAGRNVGDLSVLGAVHIVLATVVLVPGTPLDVLRPVVAFFYLLVVPGVVLVRLLRLYEEEPLFQLVTAVGLSLIFDMVLGLALSGIPASVIARPLGAEVFLPTSLVITASLFLMIRSGQSVFAPFKPLADHRYLAWALLPLAAVFVALQVQGGGTTLWMVILLAIVAATPMLLLVRRPTATECAVAVFCISLALAFHKSFVSPEFPGWDPRLEHYFASQVLHAGRWAPESSHIYQAMLSVTVLPVVATAAGGLSLATTFNLFFSVILSFIPVTIFLSLRNLFNNRWALIAAFFYLGHYVFPLVMVNVRRQIVATLLVALLILTITSYQRGSMGVRALQVALVMGVVFSHYSTVPFMAVAIGTSLLFGRLVQWQVPSVSTWLRSLPSLGLLLTLGAFTYLWFTWASGDSLLTGFVSAGERIVTAIRDDLLLNRQVVSISTGLIPDGISYILLLFANWAIVLAGLLGFALCLFGILRRDPFRAFLGIIGSGGILLGALFMVIPQTTESLVISRTVLMTLLWLLPLSIFGIKQTFRIPDLLKTSWRPTSAGAVSGLLLLVYMALGTGLVTHLVGDKEFSYALDSELALGFHDQAALRLVSTYGRNENRIYTDKLGQALFRTVYPTKGEFLSTPNLPTRALSGFYLYLRRANLQGEWGTLGSAPFASPKLSEPTMVEFINSLRNDMDLVFNSGGAELYYSPEG